MNCIFARTLPGWLVRILFAIAIAYAAANAMGATNSEAQMMRQNLLKQEARRLDVANSTRRLMWTLAHAHGSLLGLIHRECAATVQFLKLWGQRLLSPTFTAGA